MTVGLSETAAPDDQRRYPKLAQPSLSPSLSRSLSYKWDGRATPSINFDYHPTKLLDARIFRVHTYLADGEIRRYSF